MSNTNCYNARLDPQIYFEYPIRWFKNTYWESFRAESDIKIICFILFILSPVVNAHSFILVYNHPSEDQSPTKEDHKITEEMIEVGRVMRIPLKNHVIIGKGCFSFFERDCRENGWK